MIVAPWAALAAPFAPGEVKTRPQGRITLSYVTARTVMNRLDEVLGPENWWDSYLPLEHSVLCTLTIRLADGSIVAKQDAGGYAGMTDQGDDDKSGFSDAFKRAAVKFGVGRYLYRDGVPAFAVDNGNGIALEPEPVNPSRDGAWLARMAAKRGAVDWFSDYGCKHGLPRDMALWSKHIVALALDARRAHNKANGRQESHR